MHLQTGAPPSVVKFSSEVSLDELADFAALQPEAEQVIQLGYCSLGCHVGTRYGSCVRQFRARFVCAEPDRSLRALRADHDCCAV